MVSTPTRDATRERNPLAPLAPRPSRGQGHESRRTHHRRQRQPGARSAARARGRRPLPARQSGALGIPQGHPARTRRGAGRDARGRGCGAGAPRHAPGCRHDDPSRGRIFTRRGARDCPRRGQAAHRGAAVDRGVRQGAAEADRLGLARRSRGGDRGAALQGLQPRTKAAAGAGDRARRAVAAVRHRDRKTLRPPPVVRGRPGRGPERRRLRPVP